jgi:hypothetical protein
MKALWILTLALLRPLYFIYSLCCLVSPLFILYGASYFFYLQLPSPNSIGKVSVAIILGIFVLLAVLIPIQVYRKNRSDNPNPFQSAFLSWFGTLRWYWNTTPGPMVKVGLASGYLVENPKNYRLTAEDMRAILEKLQPGDILLRGYDGYIDGMFIRRSALCSNNSYQAGWFTHAAFYAGPLTSEDQAHVPQKYRHNKKYFFEGPQMVLHSMAKGVHVEDILTWFRCDYLAVLRIKPELKMDHKVEHPSASSPREERISDFDSQKIKQKLRQGEVLDRAAAIQNAKLSGLEKIGEPYNFECIITDKFNRFSCAEFVYFCYRSIHDAIGLSPQLHAFYPFGKLSRRFHIMGRNTVTPDDFYDLAKKNHLDVVWVDEISKKRA